MAHTGSRRAGVGRVLSSLRNTSSTKKGIMTTYEEALKEAKKTGLKNCSDHAAMAAWCENILPYVVGALSPRLVWEGAQKSGMSLKDLNNLAVHAPMSVVEMSLQS